jgi:hypothetical protein
MSPAAIALLIQLIELAIKEEPAIALELHDIFSNPNPSADDWQALREKVLSESFDSLAPHAAADLPAESVTTPAETAGAASQDAAAAPTLEQPLVADTVTCGKCGAVSVANSPTNCNC